MCGPKQEKVRKPWVLRLYSWIVSMQVSEEERNVWDGVWRGKQFSYQFREVSRNITIYSIESHTSDFIFNTFWNGKPMQIFQESCWVVVAGCQEKLSCSKVLDFLEKLDDRIGVLRHPIRLRIHRDILSVFTRFTEISVFKFTETSYPSSDTHRKVIFAQCCVWS